MTKWRIAVFTGLVASGLLALEVRANPVERASSSTATTDEAIGYGAAPLLEEIRTRQAKLDRRERELDDRERQVADLESTVESRLGELEQIGQTVERRIAEWQEANGDTIRRLAKIYAAMPPQQAAPLIEQLEVELATQILSKMKHKQSAAVLALVSDDRALAMSRKVAHPLGMKPANPSSLER